jgi:hypothetical protein
MCTARAAAMTNCVQVLLLVAKAWSAVTSAFGASPDSDVAEGLNPTTTAGSLKRLHSSSSSSNSLSKSSRALQHSSRSSRAMRTATVAVAETSSLTSALTWQSPQPPLDYDSDRTLSLTALRSVLTGYSVRLSSEEAAWVLARLGSSYDLSSGSTVAAIAATPRKGDRSSVNSPRSSSRRAGTTPRQCESVATAAATVATRATAATAGAAAVGTTAEHNALLAGRVVSSGSSSVVLTADGQQQHPAALLKQVTLAAFFYAVFDVEAAAQVSLQLQRIGTVLGNYLIARGCTTAGGSCVCSAATPACCIQCFRHSVCIC